MMTYRGRPAVDEYLLDTERLGGHASFIAPGLFLGSCESAQLRMGEDLRALGITAILNCTTDREVPCHFEEGRSPPPPSAAFFTASYARVGVHDNETASIYPYLSGGADFIARHIGGSGGDGAVLALRARRVAVSEPRHGVPHEAPRNEPRRRLRGREARPARGGANAGFWKQLGDFEASLKALPHVILFFDVFLLVRSRCWSSYRRRLVR